MPQSATVMFSPGSATDSLITAAEQLLADRPRYSEPELNEAASEGAGVRCGSRSDSNSLQGQ